ncbi:hypothetical protein [Nocardioides sp. CER19]|uniref:hypothetical protein n=1 Tax=Nocardioides sp. CER19 TaxID=3038538 RepID=UPI002447119E|nr:hypothetical protein [Nocardioides sp. CER19]MDH2412968.1 hypothetical protein [Nocardioides sp. CER19]
MNSSGIKRGLAASAISALAVVGVPCAAFAAPSTDAYTITLTPSATSVSTGDAVSYKVEAKKADGTAATGDVTINLSAAVSGTEAAGDVVINGTGVALDGTQDKNIVAPSFDVAAGSTFTVSSKVTATVSVKATANGAAKSSSFVVGGDKVGNDNIKTISASSVPASLYAADSATVDLKALDASGFGVQGAQLSYTLDNGAKTAVPGGATAEGSYTRSITLSNAVGSHTLKVWADQTTGDNTPAADASEPVATISWTVVATPSLALNTAGFSSTAPVAGLLPADEAVTVPVTVKVDDVSGTRKVAAGTPVAIDVTVGGGDTVRYPATTDANGLATVSVQVTKAQAVDGDSVYAELYASKSPLAGQGSFVDDATIATFDARQAEVKLLGNGGLTNLQATRGGTVSVQVEVSDQFGKPVAGDVLSAVITGANPTAAGTPKQVTTNAAGQATLSYADTATAGGDTIVFSDTTHTGTTGATFTVQFVKSTAVAAITATAVAAGTHTVDSVNTGSAYTVRVANADGVALTNTNVTFTTNLGFIEDAKGNKGTSATVKTDGNGDATVKVGSTKVGEQTVSVTAGAAPAKAFDKQTYTVGNFYGFTVNAPAELVEGGTAKVTATATDRFGNPRSNEDVYATQTGAGSFSSGVSSLWGTTGPDGSVSFTLSAGSAAGAGSVTLDPGYAAIGTPAADATVSAYAGPVTSKYAVKAPVVVTPPAKPTPVTPKAISASLKATSGSARDILAVSAAAPNGTTVTLYKKVKGQFVKVTAGTISAGKKVFRIKDANGNKKSTTYKAVVSASKTTKAASTAAKSVK